MCGIFGFLSDSPELDEKTIRKMADRIRHRGPDGLGFYFENGVCVGNHRLSIIDLVNGDQPFVSQDGNTIVVQNGEIYNFIELQKILVDHGYKLKTNSDTEVILGMFEVFGSEFIHYLNGMFAIAIYRVPERKMFVYRDRLGEKPLYYTNGGNGFVFASEIKALIPALQSLEPDFEGLSLFLSLGFIPPPYTGFKNVQQLEPGHCLEIDKSSFVDRKWWHLNDYLGVNLELRQADIIDKVSELFDYSVSIRMRADVDFGLFLSGGVDSALTLSYMREHISKRLKAYSISFRGTKFDEFSNAEFVAQKFGVELVRSEFSEKSLDLWERATYFADLPHADPSFIPTMTLANRAQKDVKMVLSGDGADEVFGGYGKYLESTRNSEIWKTYLEDHAIFKNHVLSNFLSVEDFLQDRAKHFVGADLINQYLAMDLTVLLPGNNLMKPDKMGMSHGLECRTPFMDHKLVEFALGLSGDSKIFRGETKYILKTLLSRYLPVEFVFREKQMFVVPVTEWDQNLLPQKLLKVFHSSHLLREIVSLGDIESLISLYHYEPLKSLKKVRALIALGLWHITMFSGLNSEIDFPHSNDPDNKRKDFP
jgi:asparagine synthase (glutamine-hydrolysing)